MKRIACIAAWGMAALALAGCAAEKTPDPIQSLSKATENTEHLVMFEATKAVWMQYNVSPDEASAASAAFMQPTEAAPVINSAEADAVPFGALDNPSSDAPTDAASHSLSNGSSDDAPTAEIGLSAGGEASNPGFYTLQAGETPKCIARRYNLNYIQLYSINGINFKNESLIGEGKVLVLPQRSSWQTEVHGSRAILPHPAEHAVVAGETLYTIACAYGDVTPEAIAVENGLTSPDQLVPGMLLKIP